MRVPLLVAPAIAWAGLIASGPGQIAIQSWAGSSALDQFGRVLLVLPDLDGDSRPEIASGSPLAQGSAGAQAGVVEIRSGRTGTLLLRLEGSSAGDRFGSALAAADVDGDGSPELLVGAPLAAGPAGSASGRLLVYGLPSGSLLFVLQGDNAGDRFGSAVIALPDLTGDGRREFATSAPFHDGAGGTNCGRVTIHSGLGPVLAAFEGSAAHDRTGWTLALLGDVDGDFLPELAVGSPFAAGPSGPGAGLVDVITTAGVLLWTIHGSEAGARLGIALAACGDLGGSPAPDLVVGADLATTSGGANAGLVQAFDGASLGLIWTSQGAQAGARHGAALTAVLDATADGRREVAVGAPTHDGVAGLDAGRTALLDGATGAELFAVQGTAPGEQWGFALAGSLDLDLDGQGDFVAGAPLASPSGLLQAGRARALGLAPGPGLAVRGYPAPGHPEAVAACDADGDGDQDLVVALSAPPAVLILWNGIHLPSGPGYGPGVFDQIPATLVPLGGAGLPLAISGGQLDGDSPAEIAVARDDGAVQIVDGSGPPTSPAFAALAPFQVDVQVPPSPASAVIHAASPPAIDLWVALRGGAFAPGSVFRVTQALLAPGIAPATLTGPAISSIGLSDLDGDLQPDLIIAQSVGGAATITVLGGASGFPLAGTPASLGLVAPTKAEAAALDVDLVQNDLVVATLGLSGGGLRILRDYIPGQGFSSLVSAGPPQVRSATAWRRSETSRGIVLADGQGRVRYLEGFTGTGFASDHLLLSGDGITSLITAQLTGFDGGSACNGQEIVLLDRARKVVRVVRPQAPGLAAPVPFTGCPPEAPVAVASVLGTPVLGDAAFGLALAGATPSAPLTLVLQIAPAGLFAPLVIWIPPCTFAWLGGGFDLLPAGTVSPMGTGHLPIPLPADPALLCIDFLVTWLIQDGGPVLGGFTLSNTLFVRLGEHP